MTQGMGKLIYLASASDALYRALECERIGIVRARMVQLAVEHLLDAGEHDLAFQVQDAQFGGDGAISELCSSVSRLINKWEPSL